MIKNFQKGFTLIEVMVVISIISFLSSIGFYVFGTARANAQDAVTVHTALAISNAVTDYQNSTGQLPVAWTNNVMVNETQTDEWEAWMNPLISHGSLNAIPKAANRKPLWVAKYVDANNNAVVVIGFGYSGGGNGGGGSGGSLPGECNPFGSGTGGSSVPLTRSGEVLFRVAGFSSNKLAQVAEDDEGGGLIIEEDDPIDEEVPVGDDPGGGEEECESGLYVGGICFLSPQGYGGSTGDPGQGSYSDGGETNPCIVGECVCTGY
jgi:prepilin-type N-terminal cleavage/methylation domain-containing protein